MTETQIPNVLSITKLLNDCQVLSKEESSSVMASAARDGITVGKHLHRSGRLEPQLIRGAIFCHMLLRQKLISYSTVLQALESVVKEKKTIEEALAGAKWNRVYFENLLALWRLLHEAALVKLDELNLAYEICLRDKQPLLPILIQRESITDVLADRVLLLHEQIISKRTSFAEAVQTLKHSSPQAASAHDSEGKSNSGSKHLRLGELLLAAELVTSVQLIGAVEKARAEKVPFGKILVRDFSIPEDAVEQAVFVQSLINSGFVSVYDGVQRVINFKNEGG